MKLDLPNLTEVKGTLNFLFFNKMSRINIFISWVGFEVVFDLK